MAHVSVNWAAESLSWDWPQPSSLLVIYFKKATNKLNSHLSGAGFRSRLSSCNELSCPPTNRRPNSDSADIADFALATRFYTTTVPLNNSPFTQEYTFGCFQPRCGSYYILICFFTHLCRCAAGLQDLASAQFFFPRVSWVILLSRVSYR